MMTQALSSGPTAMPAKKGRRFLSIEGVIEALPETLQRGVDVSLDAFGKPLLTWQRPLTGPELAELADLVRQWGL